MNQEKRVYFIEKQREQEEKKKRTHNISSSFWMCLPNFEQTERRRKNAHGEQNEMETHTHTPSFELISSVFCYLLCGNISMAFVVAIGNCNRNQLVYIWLFFKLMTQWHRIPRWNRKTHLPIFGLLYRVHYRLLTECGWTDTSVWMIDTMCVCTTEIILIASLNISLTKYR